MQQGRVSRFDLDTCRFAVMTHAHLTHAELANETFRAIDLRQRLQSYRRAVRDARGETCESRLVPRRQSHSARQFPHLSLIEIRIDERRDHMLLDCCSASGPPIAEIVNIQTVKHRCQPFGARELSDTRIHFSLAEIATIRRVREIVLVLGFEGTNDYMTRANCLGQLLRLFEFAGWQRLAQRRNANRALAEFIMSNSQNKS